MAALALAGGAYGQGASPAPATATSSPGRAATGADAEFRLGLEKAYRDTRLLEGLALDDMDKSGQRRTLELDGDRQLLFFHMSRDGDDTPERSSTSSTQSPTSSAADGAAGATVAAGDPPAPASAPRVAVTRQPIDAPAPASGTDAAPAAQPAGETRTADGSSLLDPDPLEGRFYVFHQRDEMELARFRAKKGDDGVNLKLRDVVFLFSSEAHKERLSKLALPAKTSRYLRQFAIDRRQVELPKGGRFFARLVIKDNPFFDKLDGALNFKEDEVLVQGNVSARMLRRVLGLKVPAAKPDIGRDDLDLAMSLEGFRPRKIGRYVDAQDARITLRGDDSGKLVLHATARARFGIGSRKIKIPASIVFEPGAGADAPVFMMTASAGKDDLKRVTVDRRKVTELAFAFSLDNELTPKLRAEGKAGEGADQVPISGELDEEDGQDLFRLDGSTLEAISGLDIPGLDEIRFPNLPKLNTSRAVTLDTKVRDRPASVVVGPIVNDEATYVALSLEGGLETLLPGSALGDVGSVDTGRSIFLYLPKGRAPPALSALPQALRTDFSRAFDADELADARPGLTMFQSSRIAESHPFARAVNLFRKGPAKAGEVQIVGRLNPLVFDEPEDGIRETWMSGNGSRVLREILSGMQIEARIDGLDGLGIGSYFRLADRASFELRARGNELQSILKFGASLKLRGQKQARPFEFLVAQRSSGQFTWQGVEVDEDGEDVSGGQQIKIAGRIANNRPEDLRVWLNGAYRLGDVFATQIAGISDLEIRNLSLARGYVHAGIGLGKDNSTVTIVDQQDVRLAVVNIDKNIRPARYIPGLDRTPFTDLALPESVVLVAGDNVDRAAVQALPNGMGDILLTALDRAGVSPTPGITYVSRLNFDGKDPLSGLARRLGVPADDVAILHGKIPAGVVRAIAGTGGRPKAADLAGLELSASLPRLALPGIGRLFALSDVSTLNLTVDESGTPNVSVRSRGTFTMPIVKTSEEVSLAANIMGGGADREVLVEVNSISLNDRGEPRLKMYAAAPLALNALKSAQGFVASVENGMTLSDVLGRDVPGIGGLTLAEARLSLNHVAGVLELGDARLAANIASLGDGPSLRNVIMTLEAEGLPGVAAIPGLDKTPLKSIRLDHGVLVYLPSLQGSEGGIALSDLPDVMQPVLAKLQDASGAPIAQLQQGLNLISLVDSNNLGPLTKVLDRLASKGGGKKFKLTASMPGDALAFVGDRLSALKAKLTKKKSNKPPLKERIRTAASKAAGKARAGAAKAPAKAKALAARLLPTIIKKVKINIPVPGISLPGIGTYLASESARISVVGSENPETRVVALRTSVSSKFRFAVPGTPTAGTVDSDLVVIADSSKELSLDLTGLGRLENVDAELALAGAFVLSEKQPDLAIAIRGSGLTLNALTGLSVPGVTDLALNRATVKAGELSGEIELKSAVTKVAAFGFTRTRRPLLALESVNVDAARYIPGVEGSVLDAAVLDRARFLFVPESRAGDVADIQVPAIFADTIDRDAMASGLNAELRVTPKAGTPLWELLRGIGVTLDGPVEIEGQLPANLFTGPRQDVLAQIRLSATLPKLSFSSIGSVQMAFSEAPALFLNGTEKGLAGRVESGLAVTLPAIGRTYRGNSVFTVEPADEGGRQLAMLATTTDPGGRKASIEATMLLPGSPRDFRLRFAGEQTLSSLLGIEIPVIGDLNLSELEKGEDFLVAKLKLNGAETDIGAFKVEGHWAVAVSATGIKPANFIPGLDNLPVGNLVLPDASFVLVPPRRGGGEGLKLSLNPDQLPAAVKAGLQDALSTFGNVETLRGGLNLVSILDPSKMPGLDKVFSLLGTRKGGSSGFRLSGLLPMQSLKSLLGKGSAFKDVAADKVKVLIRGVDLDTTLPVVSLPGVRDIVTYENPRLRIKGDETDGDLKLAMGIGGDMRITLPNVPAVDLGGNIAFVLAQKALALDVSGVGSSGSRKISVAGRINLSKQDPRLQLAFTSDVTVADLIGEALPGIADLALIDARFGSEIISGTMRYRGAETTFAAFDYRADKKPFVALLSENVDAANFIPGVAGSPLDNARLATGALVYVPNGKSAFPRSTDYPERLSRALAFVSKDYAVSPTQGLKAGFDLAFKEGAPLTRALKFIGYKENNIRLTGALPTNLLTSRGGGNPFSVAGGQQAAGRAAGLAGEALKVAVKGVDLEARVPALNIPGVDKVVEFGDPFFRIRGGDVLDAAGNPTGEVKLRVGIDGSMTLKLPDHALAFDGGFDIEKASGGKAFRLALYTTSRLGWDKAFGLPFLKLDELAMAGAIEQTADGTGRLAASLSSRMKIDKLTFNSTAAVAVSTSGTAEVRFTVDNKIRISDLPGLGSVPGINEVAFDNLWVGTGGLGGRAEIEKLGIGGDANLFLHGGRPVLMVKADQLSLKDLLPKTGLNQMWDQLLGLSFPNSIFALSTVDLSKTKISSLPAGVQPMLAGFGDSSGVVGVKDGISLMAALTEDNLPPALKTIVTGNMNIFDPSVNGGIDGPLMLSGSLNGIFTGALKARLAVRLPQLKLPKPSNDRQWARMIKLDGVGGEGFLEIDVPNTAFWLGARANLSVEVPHIDDPKQVDELTFAGNLIAGFDLVSWAGAFKISGNMEGTWRKPFGFHENYSLKNPAILVGVDSEGSVEFGVGASVLITGLRGGRHELSGDVDFLININFSTSFPLPKKLAVNYRLNGEVWPLTFIEEHEVMLKGVLTGPMANVILDTPGLPADAKRNLKDLQDKIRKFSILDALQIDKLPLPYLSLQNPVIYFATPGAKIPGREETLDSAGFRLGGILNMEFMGEKKRMGGADFRLTLTDGLIAKADIADIKLPPALTLTNTKLDVVANLKQLPHFKLSGFLNILGAREEVDVEMSKDRIAFSFERDLGRVIKTRFHAQTDSGDLLKARDFVVTANVETGLDDVLTKEIFPRMGIPPVVADILKKSTPLFIHGATFNGKLREFLEAKTPVTLEIDHSFFGTRMEEPAVARVVPAWASSDPTEVFPVASIAAAMTKSFFKYVTDNPIALGKVNLGLMVIENASLTATSDGSNRFQLNGKLSALGLPFSETSVILDDKSGVTVDSWTEVNLQLPLGPLGNLGKSRTDLHYELNPRALSHAIDLKVSTSALGFQDHIYFNFRGDMNRTTVTFYSDNPCAKFRSTTELEAGDLRNFAFKMQQGTISPLDLVKLVNFKPEIALPTPADALQCGGRVIALVGSVVDVVDKGLKEIDKASKEAIKFAGNIANEIFKGLSHLASCLNKHGCAHNFRREEILLRSFRGSYRTRNMCADIRGRKARTDTDIIIYPCHMRWNQAFIYEGKAIKSIKREGNSLPYCFGVSEYRNNSRVKLVKCWWKDVLLLFDFLENGQIRARHAQHGGDLCLATKGGHLVIQHCPDPREFDGDKWGAYEPARKSFMNPAGERAAEMMRKAYRRPLSNDEAVPFFRFEASSTGEQRHTWDGRDFAEASHWSLAGRLGLIYKNRARGTVPLFFYERRSAFGVQQAFTTDPHKFSGGVDGFSLEGVAGYLYPNEFPGSIALHQFENGQRGHYVLTTERQMGSGWRYHGIAGYAVAPPTPPADDAPFETSNPELLADTGALVFPKRAEGTIAIYRYRNPRNNDVLYTTNFAELGAGDPWFAYEGIAGWVFPEERAGTTPIYRYYNKQARRHDVTADPRKRNGQRGGGGYEFQTVLGYALTPDFGPGNDARIVNARPYEFMRYVNPATNDHMYTADPDQLGDGDDGYVRDGVAGGIFRDRARGTVPLYRYWNERSKDHIYTTRFSDLWFGKDGYEYVGVEGYVFAEEQRGTRALHRYVNHSSRDNLLTTNFDEFNGRAGRDGFTYVGIEGWVPAAPTPADDVRVTGWKAVDLLEYRHPDRGDSRLVTGLFAGKAEAEGYRLERAAGTVSLERAKGSVALYEYLNPATGDHLYSSDFSELGRGRVGFVYQGILGWLRAGQGDGAVALHRYRHRSTGDHRVTADFDSLGGTAGKDGYIYEGVVGWAAPFRAPGADAPIEKTEPKLLVRYINDRTRDHRLMLGDAAPGEGYEIESILGHAWEKRASGTRPLYHYYNSERGDHLYTHDYAEYWHGRDGYVYEGILGYVHARPDQGGVPLHRYFGRSQLDTLLTTDFGELDGKNGADGYHYARIEGYVLPFHAPGTQAKIVKAEAVPFVRYFNPGTDSYALMAGSGELGDGADGFRIERTQGRIVRERAQGTVPLYRYRNGRGGQVYSSDFSEYLFGKQGLTYAGIAGYVYPGEQRNLVALHRYDHPGRRTGVLSGDFDEFGREGGRYGYVYKGIVGWVPDYPERPVPGFDDIYFATNANFSCLDSDDQANTILFSGLCAARDDMRFALWQDGTIRHRTTGLCLAPPRNSSDRAAIATVACDYTELQKWELRWDGRAPGAPDGKTLLQLVHSASGKCLGLQNASAQDGVEADLYACEAPGDNVQSWRVSKEVPQYVVPGTDAPVQAGEPEWLVRYLNPTLNGGDNVVTVGFGEFGRGKNGYLPVRLMARLHETRNTRQMVPLYRYRNAGIGDHLFTTDFHEFRFAKDGYSYERLVGYVYPNEVPGSVALHRYFNPSLNDTVLSADFQAFGGNSGRNGYRYQGVVGWTPGTGAVAPAPWNSVHVANLGGMVCLLGDEGNGIASSRCDDATNQSMGFFTDGTIRFGGEKTCLEAGTGDDRSVFAAPCDANLKQRWEVDWQGGKAGDADGRTAFQLRHWWSGRCVVLEDGAGVDGIAATMDKCTDFAAEDRRGTWWAHATVPTFTAPGSDAPVTPSEPEPLIAYLNEKAKGGDHRLAAGPGELGLGKDGYEMGKAVGKIYPKRAAGTVPLYRYVNVTDGDHDATTDFRRHGWGYGGYRYEGVAGYVFDAEQPNSVALHAFHDATGHDYLLTPAPEDFGGTAGRGAHAYLGIDAWVPRYPEDPETGFEGLYLSTNGHLSCLDGGGKAGAPVTSSFCGDHEMGQFSFWQDGTFRHDATGLCAEPDARGDGLLLVRCAYTRVQHFTQRWQNARPSAADGKEALQIVHVQSGRCVGLADASGQDGVAAVLSACEAPGEGVQTWIAGPAKPEFVAPGMAEAVGNDAPKIFIRYAHQERANGDHMMQVGPEPYGLGRDGYDMQLAQGWIYPTRTADTVPLYRYLAKAGQDTLYTLDFHEFRYARSGTVYDGVVGYVHADEKPGTVALHRFVNAARGDHVLASNIEEFGGRNGKAGYKYDGVVGWVPRYDEDPAPGLTGIHLATNGNLSCLDADGEAGTTVRSRFCETEGPVRFSRWTDGTFRNDASGLCLTLRGNVRAGAPVKAERCSYTPDQQWVLNWQGADPGGANGIAALKLVHRESGLCIGLENGSGQDGVPAIAQSCTAATPDLQAFVAGTEVPVFTPPGMELSVEKVKPLPFIRYHNATARNGDHLMHVGPEIFGLGRDGYDMQLAQGMAFPGRAPDTVPLYRYVDSSNGDHIYSSDFHEFRYARGNVAYDGIVGFVHAEERQGTVALHRYVHAGKGDHLLSAHFDEMGGRSGRDGYAYDGIVGHVPDYPERPRNGFTQLYAATNGNLSCLDAEARDGAFLASSFCEDHAAGQVTVWQDGTVRHAASNLCFDLPANVKAGTTVSLARCSYRDNQQWTLKWDGNAPKSADGRTPLNLVHRDSGLCVGLRDASGQDGVEAAAFNCGASDRDTQKWVFSKERPVFTPPLSDLVPETSDSEPFVRYARSSSGAPDHVMQPGYRLWGTGRNDYVIEHPQGRVFPKRGKGMTPFYRYRNDATRQHLYTRDFHEFRYARDGYVYDDAVGFVYAQEATDLVPLHRYDNTGNGDQILTTDFETLNGRQGRRGYQYSGVAAWVPKYEAKPVAPLEGVFAVADGWMCLVPADGPGSKRVELQPCAERDDWRFTAFNDDTLRLADGSLCLAVGDETITGALEPCRYRSPRQVFDVMWDGKGGAPGKADGSRELRVRHAQSSRCLTLQGRARPGVRLQLADCGRPAQNWQVYGSFPAAAPVEALQHVQIAGAGDRCMEEASPDSGHPVRLGACDQETRSTFSLFEDDTVRHDRTGLCLTALEGSDTRSPLVLSACMIRSPHQLFEVLWNGKGRAPATVDPDRAFRLKHDATAMCVRVRNGGSTTGDAVTLAKCANGNGREDQNWRFRVMATQ
jgi:hypothetical protein